jgi:hypothetical protein
MGLGRRLLDDVVANGCGLNLRGEACCPHSSANLWRLGLSGLTGLLIVISTGSGEGQRSVSCGSPLVSGDGLRLVLCDVSTGSGANFRFVFLVVSTGSGANLRLVFVVVSTGSGANLRVGFGFAACSSTDRSLEDITEVSMGSILNRLGGAADSIVKSLV